MTGKRKPSVKKRPAEESGEEISERTEAESEAPSTDEEPAGKKGRTQSIIKALKTRYPGRVFRGTEYTMPWLLKRLPTGVLGLDIALSGGLPAGGFSMIYGSEGIGKNWIANRVIHHQQMLLGDECSVAVISTEMPYDKQFAKVCEAEVGFSSMEIAALDQTHFAETGEHLTPEYKESLRVEIGTFITAPPDTAEKSFDIALDVIKSRSFDVVVIDSFGSLLTEEDDEKNMDDGARVGGASLVNTRFARKMNAAFAPDKDGRPNMTCVIGINQLRDNMDRANKYSPKTHEGGGWALKHARWVGIELQKLGKVKEGKEGAVIGKTVGWEITKQKAGGHEGGRGNYDFLWALGGIDRCKESLRVAVDLAVIEKSGAWYAFKGQRIGCGLAAATEFVRNNNLLGEIETAALKAAGIRCNYSFKFADD